MIGVSLFAGIGGFDLAMKRAGITVRDQVEIDKAAKLVLRRHFPEAELYNDVKTYTPHGSVDLICGGFPCQDVSIAGRRAGLAGERSGLWSEFYRIIAMSRSGWVIIENVPGLLSSNGGRDFAFIVHGLAKCGYGVAWRIFDAQYFGVAQRRRRVFIVGHLGDGCAAQVLFERKGLPGDTPPSREKGPGVAHAITHGPSSGYRYDPNGEDYIADTLTADYHKQGGNGMGQMENGIIAFDSDRDGLDATDELSPTLKHGGSMPHHHNAYCKMALAYNVQHNDGGDHRRKDRPNGGMYVKETDTALTVGSADLTAVMGFKWHASNTARSMGEVNDGTPPITDKQPGVVGAFGVRRLTPIECERLQGFPDGWTAGQADSTRYRQLGNAVAIPVVEWIMKRIVQQ